MSGRTSAPGKGSVPAVVPVVNREMRVAEILALCPESADVMAAYGLHCFSCSLGGVESLNEGCGIHGFDDETVEALVDDLNELLREQPARPAELNVTGAAAKAVREIAEKEDQAGLGLAVIADGRGGFCMEFRTDADREDAIFTAQEEPEVRFFASPVTLWRIGGATIDFRDGRFKLDLVDEATPGCGCTKETCGCH